MSANSRDMIEDMIHDFIVDRRASSRSRNTIDFYLSQLKILSCFCYKNQVKYIDEISANLLRELFVLMSETGHSEGGKDALWRTLKVFFRWYHKEIDSDPGFRNPLLKITRPNHNPDPIPGISEIEFVSMINTCDKTFYGQRNRAIMMLMYDSGIRVSELCDLNCDDLDRVSGVLRIRHGKGNKKRTVFAGAKTLKEIIKYLRMHPGTAMEDPLFAHKGGGRFDRKGIAAILYKAAGEAHIETVPSPHDFRRAFATQSLRNGANLKAVRDQLGHSTYAIVDRYAQLNVDDLHDQHVISSPVDRIKKS